MGMVYSSNGKPLVLTSVFIW